MAYNERILATSQSQQRRHRAGRMLANLRPLVEQLEETAREAGRAAPPASTADDEFEVVFSGKDSLSKFVKDTA